MTRRELLAGAAAVLAAGPIRAARKHITRASISALTDEVGLTQADAIAFAHQYGLQWVELRNVPETKKEFAKLTEPELKRWASQLAAEKLKVSFLNTSLLKFTWPGTVPAHGREEDAARLQHQWDRRKEDTRNAVLAANILGTDKIRVFTGSRVANPEQAFPLIVRTLEELVPIAESGRVKLLIENEFSQNIGTSAESKAILELLPSKSIGLNWDPHNGLELKEVPWPDGYALVPKNRMLNTQIKAKAVLDDSPEKLDWKRMMEAMQKDGYEGQIGLETHTPGDKLIENAHQAMKNILHTVGELS